MLTLTERAAETIQRLADETAPGALLRIGIRAIPDRMRAKRKIHQKVGKPLYS